MISSLVRLVIHPYQDLVFYSFDNDLPHQGYTLVREENLSIIPRAVSSSGGSAFLSDDRYAQRFFFRIGRIFL